jgi:hypothetical protein
MLPTWEELLGPVGQEIVGWTILGLALLLLFIIKKKVTKMLAHYSIQSSLAENNKIIARISTLLADCKAQRCEIMMFHNGEYYMNGSSILKVSCAYESVTAGVSSVCEEWQNILVSQIPEAVGFLEHCTVAEPCSDMLHTETMGNCYYKSLLKAQGAVHDVRYPLYKGNTIVGFIRIQTTDACAEPEHIVDKIKDAAPEVELLINRNHKPARWWEVWK